MTDALTRTPNRIRDLAERVHDDPEAFAFDGFGVMLSSEQGEAWRRLGNPGPRRPERGEKKINYVSGGQRSGKTVELGLWHCHASLYKTGVDNTDGRFWRNYIYKTLANAPTTDLTLKLWQVMDELSKGASDAQYDRGARHARGGAFLHLLKAGTAGPWPIVRFENGSRTDFRSTEGWATRLEGDQWWFITWDEWASQPDREIEFVLTDVLMGRSRDHDSKIVPAAWPKEATERHLISAIRRIEKGDPDAQVMYLSAEDAFFSNRAALETERRRKTPAQWKRTVLGQPAGGASVEFKPDVVDRMRIAGLAYPQPREDGYRYFTSADIGLAHDLTVYGTWRIPPGGVTVESRARLVHAGSIVPSEGLTLDAIAYELQREVAAYGSQLAVDASGLGGVAAFRALKGIRPAPLSFVAKSNDRIWGNMRLAAITNALDLLTWGRPTDVADDIEQAAADRMYAWGLIEVPDTQQLIELFDQLANFDRDAKNIADDWVWMFLIGLWYIRRYWVVGHGPGRAVPFSPFVAPPVEIQRRRAYSLRRRSAVTRR